MISTNLLLKVYEAASMQRWNDQIRAFDIAELDKQAHKMIVAYVLGKYYESINESTNASTKVNQIDWIKIIEYGFFEFLQRIVLTDLKPPLFYEIKKDKEKYKKLNEWVYSSIFPYIKDLGQDFCDRFYNYILGSYEICKNYYKSPINKIKDVENIKATKDIKFNEVKDINIFNNKDLNISNESIDLNRQIIGAAHFYITKWEFDLISRFNPNGYQVKEIKKSIEIQQKKYKKLKAMEALLSSENLISFINICGQLRFQVRWSHIYRVPKTSVLGHMLIVAIFSYLFSHIAKVSRERIVNNFFTGLFHDLPEVLTRDIINPIKKSVEGLDDLIKEYEKKEMDKRVYKLLPKSWLLNFKMYTEDEFEDNNFRDGKLVKAADDLAAFIEAYLCRKNGINNTSLEEAMDNLRKKYLHKDYKEILGINFAKLYLELEKKS